VINVKWKGFISRIDNFDKAGSELDLEKGTGLVLQRAQVNIPGRNGTCKRREKETLKVGTMHQRFMEDEVKGLESWNLPDIHLCSQHFSVCKYTFICDYISCILHDSRNQICCIPC
jgi:hypothetical protein